MKEHEFMRLLVCVACVTAFAVCFTDAANAQDADPDDTRPELPDIAPHEIEIRGQLEISFPALQRQPLVGFNSPPRVPSVPEDYEPYIEEYRQDPDAERQRLPDRYALPQFADRPDPNIGDLEAQVGRYFSRIGRARFDIPLSEQQRISFDLDYEGQDRYIPFQDTTFAPHDIFDGHISFSSTHNALTVGADLDGQLDRYVMHHPLAEEMGAVVGSRFPLREHYGGKGTAWLRFDGSVPAAIRGFYGETFFDRPEEARAPEQATERLYGFDLSVEPQIGSRYLELAGSAKIATQFENGSPGAALGLFESGLTIHLVQNTTLDVRGGVRGFGSAVNQGGLHAEAFEYYASPIIEARWQPTAEVSIYGNNLPSAQLNSWNELFDTNPYLEATPQASPSVETINAETGVTLHFEPVQVNIFGGYTYSPNHRYFEESEETENFLSILTTSYGPATAIRAGGDISVHVGDVVHASVGGSYQETRLDNLEQAIPYEAPFEAHGMISWQVAEQTLIQLTMEYLGARPVSTSFDETMNPYLSMNVRGVYDFTPNIGIVVEAQNVGPESMLERWNYHPHPPLIISSGLRVRL